MEKEMLTYAEAAEMLGLKLGTLYSLVAHQRVPYVRLGKRLVRFRKDDLKRWLDERLVKPTDSDGEVA